VLKYTKKFSTALGFTAALGGGILAGIESAIMWSDQKVLAGFSFGLSSCFVNSLSYYYVVMRASTTGTSNVVQDENFEYANTMGSTTFATAATVFGALMFVSNFNGMYISYTVLGDKFNQLGDKDVNIPDYMLVGAGITFGLASAISGAVFNAKVGKQIWDEIRKRPLERLGLFSTDNSLASDDEQQTLLSTAQIIQQP